MAGTALVYRGDRGHLGVAIRLKQDSFVRHDHDELAPERYADLSTQGRLLLVEGLGLDYGVMTRVSNDTVQFMPQAAAEWHVAGSTTIQVAAPQKFDAGSPFARTAPAIGSLRQIPTMDTRYRYSVTLSSALGELAGFSASGRRAAADTLTFLLFDDSFDEFWEGLHLVEGEQLTGGGVSIRAGIGPSMQVALVADAGKVGGAMAGTSRKGYVSGDLHTSHQRAGTSLDLSYRALEQPDLFDDDVLREIERLRVVLGQSLHLSVDLRVLLGFSVANESGTRDAPRAQKRLVGGVSLSF